MRHLIPTFGAVTLAVAAATPAVYQNPLIPGKLADPAVIRHEGNYYLYATGEVDDHRGTRVYTSPDLVHWTRGPVVFEPGLPDVWRNPDTGRFYLYYTAGVWNAEPDRWPAGDPPPIRPIFYQEYGDVDESPTKSFLVRNGADALVVPHHRMAFGKRPEFELFHIPTDPDQLVNLAGKPAHAATLASLRKRLTDFLKATDDPRAANRGASWDKMPFYLPGHPPVPVTRVSHPFLFEQ